MNHDKRTALITGANRVALLGPDGPTGTFSHAKLGQLPW